MSTDPSYLRSAADGEVTQFKDWGIPLGRRFRALKLWFHLRLDGVEAIRARLRRDLANASWLAEQVARRARLAGPGAGRPADRVPAARAPGLVAEDGTVLDGEALDRHTLAWADAVNASGQAFLTPSVLDGRWMVRVSIGSENTQRSDVAATWELIRRTAAECAASRSSPMRTV